MSFFAAESVYMFYERVSEVSAKKNAEVKFIRKSESKRRQARERESESEKKAKKRARMLKKLPGACKPFFWGNLLSVVAVVVFIVQTNI